MMAHRLISERLMDLLLAEVTMIEHVYQDNKPILPGGHDGEGSPSTSRDAAGGAKERVDRIALLTRTLEKLMEVKRAEIASAAKDGGDDAETVRLRDELLRRLKLLDERRRAADGTSGDQAGTKSGAKNGSGPSTARRKSAAAGEGVGTPVSRDRKAARSLSQGSDPATA